MSTFISIIATSLQIIGLASITYVLILFFGKTDMKTLLKFTITGVLEFYGGYFILKFFGKKE